MILNTTLTYSMAKSNIEPQEGLALAHKLKQVEAQIRSLNTTMKLAVNSIQNWQDPQYDCYKRSMDADHRALNQLLTNWESNQRALQKHSQDVLEGQRRFKQRLR